MIDLIYQTLQVIGLIVIVGTIALTYMSIQRKQEREWEKRDDEVLKMLKRRNSDNVNEATSGNNIRGCHPSDNGKRD